MDVPKVLSFQHLVPWYDITMSQEKNFQLDEVNFLMTFLCQGQGKIGNLELKSIFQLLKLCQQKLNFKIIENSCIVRFWWVYAL